MSQEQWTAVDRYITDLLVPPDPALDAALQASAAAGLPPIAVSPNQGKLLHLLARVQGASTILELGTLGGYSTIWLARALPAGGRLVHASLDQLIGGDRVRSHQRNCSAAPTIAGSSYTSHREFTRAVPGSGSRPGASGTADLRPMRSASESVAGIS